MNLRKLILERQIAILFLCMELGYIKTDEYLNVVAITNVTTGMRFVVAVANVAEVYSRPAKYKF